VRKQAIKLISAASGGGTCAHLLSFAKLVTRSFGLKRATSVKWRFFVLIFITRRFAIVNWSIFVFGTLP